MTERSKDDQIADLHKACNIAFDTIFKQQACIDSLHAENQEFRAIYKEAQDNFRAKYEGVPIIVTTEQAKYVTDAHGNIARKMRRAEKANV